MNTTDMKNSVKVVLILIDNYQREKFYNRFLTAFQELSIQAIVITALPSIHKRMQTKRVLSFLASPRCSVHDWKVDDCLEYAINQTSQKLTKAIYSAFHAEAVCIFEKYEIDTCIIWNGTRTQSRALSAACRYFKVPTVYLEISNLPGKLFADPAGANAESVLFRHPGVVDAYQPPEGEYESWKCDYLDHKFRSDKVKQAVLSRKLNLHYIGDYCGWILGKGTRLFSWQYAIKSIKNSLLVKLHVVNTDELPSSNFIFLPLQCSNDSQVVLNSDVNNEDAIQFAVEKASAENLSLVLKIHPAETDSRFLKSIQALRENYKFKLCSTNTFRILDRCTSVVTINSSVGLEARILGKPVCFLGRSLYSNMNDMQLEKYIMAYLVDIDYFDTRAIHKQEIVKLISVASDHQ